MNRNEAYGRAVALLERIRAQQERLATIHGRIPDAEWSQAWQAVESTWNDALELLYKIDPDSRDIVSAIDKE